MNELIKVTQNESGEQLVSARELHSKLEITERFNSWFDRMLKYGFTENVDYTGCKVFNTQAKQELDEYILTLDMAKQICMLQRSELGTKFRLYFIECEKPTTPRPKVIPRPKSNDVERLEKENKELKSFLEQAMDLLGKAVKINDDLIQMINSYKTEVGNEF